jgi:hypothetical protein
VRSVDSTFPSLFHDDSKLTPLVSRSPESRPPGASEEAASRLSRLGPRRCAYDLYFEKEKRKKSPSLQLLLLLTTGENERRLVVLCEVGSAFEDVGVGLDVFEAVRDALDLLEDAEEVAYGRQEREREKARKG